VSTVRFLGIICFSVSLLSTSVYAQFPAAPAKSATGESQFESDRVPGSYSSRLVTASGEPEFESGVTPLIPELPDPSANKPISGLVSLRELQHPIPKKALRQAYEAQQFARVNNAPKAIVKLENAIRIYPAYRDAHLNLGVEYARVGRGADARAEFQKALDIGPPIAPIYANLALISLASGQLQQADTLARKALELDPGNSGAQAVLRLTLNH
jgi:tetratricopeptide (TPR) repeat protein